MANSNNSDDVKLTISADNEAEDVFAQFEKTFAQHIDSISGKADEGSDTISAAFSRITDSVGSLSVAGLARSGLGLLGGLLKGSGAFDSAFNAIDDGMMHLANTSTDVLAPALESVGTALTNVFFDIFPGAAKASRRGADVIDEAFKAVATGGVVALTAVEYAIGHWRDTLEVATTSAAIQLLKLKDTAAWAFKEIVLGFANTANMFTPILDAFAKLNVWHDWLEVRHRGKSADDARDQALGDIDKAAGMRNGFLGMLNASNRSGAAGMGIQQDPSISSLQSQLGKLLSGMSVGFGALLSPRLAALEEAFKRGAKDPDAVDGSMGRGGWFGNGTRRVGAGGSRQLVDSTGTASIIESQFLTRGPGNVDAAQETRKQTLSEIKAARKEAADAAREQRRELENIRRNQPKLSVQSI